MKFDISILEIFFKSWTLVETNKEAIFHDHRET